MEIHVNQLITFSFRNVFKGQILGLIYVHKHNFFTTFHSVDKYMYVLSLKNVAPKGYIFIWA
jgi:hypothetical protein